MSCKRIAQNLAKDERTISYEIKTKRYFQENFRNDSFVKSTNKECPKLLKYSFICNNCKKRYKCSFAHKAFYDAKKAQSKYEYVLVNSRIGLDITKEQFETMDHILQTGVEKGQSIAHILKNNNTSIPYSERHVYTLIAQQKLSVKKHEYIREVIPKGFIFDHLEQSHFNILVFNINSTYRPDADLVPYTIFKELFGLSAIKKLGFEAIDPN